MRRLLKQWAPGAAGLADYVWWGRRYERQYGLRVSRLHMLGGAAILESYVYVEREGGRSLLNNPAAGAGIRFNLAF